MVARDGIEPPTPAFSGPRSTTELSGLGSHAKRLIGDRQERPGVRLLHQPFQGSLPPAGSRQLKRKSSIATLGHSLQLRSRVILAPTTPLIKGRRMHRPALRLTATLLICLAPHAQAQTSVKSARAAILA